MYKTDSVDAARHILFSRTGKPEAMPPTSNALHFHLLRVHYQAMVWRNAHYATPELPSPLDMGWKDGDSGLKPILMSQNPITESCLEMIRCACKKQCTTRQCKCRKIGAVMHCNVYMSEWWPMSLFKCGVVVLKHTKARGNQRTWKRTAERNTTQNEIPKTNGTQAN